MDLKKPTIESRPAKRARLVSPSSEDEAPPTKKKANEKRVQKTEKRPRQARVNRKILIAVDFGTTFSGLAWAQSLKPELQTTVVQWPDATSNGLEGLTQEKVPTEIKYDDEGYKWGYEIAEDDQRHQWFKLDLDPKQSRENTLSNYLDSRAAPPGYNLTPEQLATDFMTALREHAEHILKSKLPAAAIDDTPKEFIITMPAVWSDKAKAKTRKCAELAGMGDSSSLHMMSEPEAAAMYALDIMDPHNLEVGDTFVLCDAGGGTVDLISYRIVTLKPTLHVEEAAPGSGDLCGASYLNRIFQKFITNELGDMEGWDEEVLEEATKKFELQKRSFGGNTNEDFSIPVSGLCDNPARGIRRGKFCLKGQDFRDIFEPVIHEVLSLIRGQIRATKSPVKGILLVGGFGQNSYMRNRIREAFEGIEVMQPPNGWTAVARGALMKALKLACPTMPTVGIDVRRARKYYGVRLARPFNAQKGDDEKRKIFDEFEGTDYISTMEWFLKKGDVVKENKPRRLEYSKQWRKKNTKDQKFYPEIYCFEDPDNTGPRKYPDEAGVKLVTKLATDLNCILKTSLPQKRGSDGKTYHVINFAIKVTHYSAHTKYELLHQGHNYGQVKAENV